MPWWDKTRPWELWEPSDEYLDGGFLTLSLLYFSFLCEGNDLVALLGCERAPISLLWILYMILEIGDASIML